jgi:DNA invertase Pin-like site-specific DNA recombinase
MSKLALRARTARRSTMRVAAYVRVSTSRQVKLETIEQQLEMVRRHAQEQGWELSEEDIFRDDGYSGTTLSRPALDALRDKARLREFEIIVVLSPDRLARNGKFTRWSSSRSSRRLAAGWSSWRDR